MLSASADGYLSFLILDPVHYLSVDLSWSSCPIDKFFILLTDIYPIHGLPSTHFTTFDDPALLGSACNYTCKLHTGHLFLAPLRFINTEFICQVASHTADRTMQRGLHIFVLSSMAAFGYVLVFITSVWAKYCGIILTGMGVYGALPIVSI